MKKLDKKTTYLAGWIVLCLLAALLRIAVPVEQQRSLGLEGANQANLKSASGELTEGRELEFELELPSDTAERIGFFFRANDHEYKEGTLTLLAFDGETQIGRTDMELAGLTEDQFVFVDFSPCPGTLTVRIRCDAVGQGPSVWLNETTVTAGQAYLDGEALDKSLVYNLTYTVQAHPYAMPLLWSAIFMLGGVGVFSVGGFSRRSRLREAALPRRKGNRLRLLAGLGCAVLAVALIFFYLYDTKIRIAQNTTERETVLASDGGTMPVTEETASISQIVRPGQDSLTGLGVRFYVEGGAELTEGSMHAAVTDLTLGETVCETEVGAESFLSGEYVGLLFHESQQGAAEHVYRIDLTFSPELWDSGLALMTSEEGVCVTAYLYFNIFLKKFFFFLFLGAEAFACLFWYLTFVRRAKLTTVFLVTVLSLGLFYNVLLTPQMAPDEAKHIDMAYRYSNELLGYESLGDTACLMRADDAAMEFTSSPSIRNYRNIYYGLFSMVQDDRMVEAEVNSNIEGSFLFYAPAALGMSLARLLGLGTVPMLLLARYLNLTVFALLAWAGMRRLPFGQMTLFVLAVLPVNMQQCTSFSHDALTHGILFFYACLCLEAIYGKERMTGQRMALLELSALFLLYCKSGSYAPLCLLPLLIPAESSGSRRRKWAAAGVLTGIPLLAFLGKQASTVAGIVSTTAATSVVSTGDGSAYLTGYTVGYFLNDPLEFVYMMANTFFDKIGFYLESLVGYQLGWVEIETSMLVVMLFWFLLFLTALDTQERRVIIGGANRFWMAFLCLGSIGMILLGMLFQWTPMGHVSVEGVQGRYFLPLMPVLLAAARPKGILLARRIDRGIAAAAVSGQLLTVMYVIRQVTTV
ncbi:MAG: DUF2142 domain-containing protein [Eubacteriales bacterium]|nr:DUF2142 domain-containing protein [Eubacteriales bacterium]